MHDGCSVVNSINGSKRNEWHNSVSIILSEEFKFVAIQFVRNKLNAWDTIHYVNSMHCRKKSVYLLFINPLSNKSN